jgi:hypothetical protein
MMDCTRPARFAMLVMALCTTLFAVAQTPQGRITGTVLDAEARYPLPGATVQLLTTDDAPTATDMNGGFAFDLPVGRHQLRVSFMGYTVRTLDGIVVNSGRPTVLEVEMAESVVAMQAAEVTATKQGEVLNEMATVSARAFTVEETDRYAGSRGDPARMASNFAGVQGADDSRNDIVVRGNSPAGVLWRVEGVDLPNPNHFSVPGSGGGPVAIVNNKTLANSDFFTAAFPAEFGNSTAAVFDLRLRNGNKENWQASAQLGFLGTEALIEGPLNKEKGSTMLLNYRYSTAVIFSKLGIDIGTSAVPKYQDGSFRFHFPQKNGGALALWGLGGKSSVDIVISDQIAPERNIYGDNDRDQYFRSNMGITGATYTLPLNKKTYIKATLAASRDRQFSNHNLVYRELEVPPNVADSTYRLDSISPFMAYDFMQDRLALALHANRKLSPIAGGPATLRFGLNADLTRWTFLDSIRALPEDPSAPLGEWGRRWDAAMNSLLMQPFAQLKLRPSETWTVNVGWHAQFDQRSGATSWFEPRIGLKYITDGGSVWSAGSGLHSQTQAPYLYASSTGADPNDPRQLRMPNQNMGFTRSWHNVIGWARSLSPNWSLKLEAYHQHLFDIPIADTTTTWGQANGSYSLVNAGSSFSRLFPGTLSNAGTSRNYGVEATLSRAFRDGWFVLLTGSVFDAQFKGADNVWRNTDYNGRYALNALGSREWRLNERGLSLVTGAKCTMVGGRWYGPVDVAASNQLREIIYEDADRNTLQFKDYFRLDLKTNLTWNRPTATHELGIDFVNILGTQNVLKLTYAPDENGNPEDSIREEYQLGFLPVFFYRVDL